MSEDDANDGFEARLRWIADQLGRSADRFEEIDFERAAREMGIDVDRAQEMLEGVGRWLSERGDSLATDAASTFGAFLDSTLRGGTPASSPGGPTRGSGRSPDQPHPLDPATPAQGLALAAIDSGRWTVQPGSHEITTSGEGPPPGEAVELVGELRARDWIDSSGTLTMLGRDALRRWTSSADPA